MILDATLRLEAVLAGAVSANQPEAHVDYIVYNNQGGTSKPAPFRVALNGNTDVTILATPGTQGFVLEPLFISIYNKDTASVTVTIKTDDGTTERIVCKAALLTLEVLIYEKGQGWYVMTASGGLKQGAVSVPTSSTDNAVVRWDGASGTAIQNSGVIVDDSNNVTGVVAITPTGLVDISGASAGQVKFPATQNASSNANTLDDYEEGSFTPSDASGAALTFSAASGSYVKVGSMVSIQALVVYPATVDGSNAAVGNLPFVVASASLNRAGAVISSDVTTLQSGRWIENSSTLGFETNAGVRVINSAMSLKTIYIGGVYFV